MLVLSINTKRPIGISKIVRIDSIIVIIVVDFELKTRNWKLMFSNASIQIQCSQKKKNKKKNKK